MDAVDRWARAPGAAKKNVVIPSATSSELLPRNEKSLSEPFISAPR